MAQTVSQPAVYANGIMDDLPLNTIFCHIHLKMSAYEYRSLYLCCAVDRCHMSQIIIM